MDYQVLVIQDELVHNNVTVVNSTVLYTEILLDLLCSHHI